MATLTDDLLTDDMLARFDERAPLYDRENRFFDEDFDELRRSGYLLCAVPTEFGGAGLGLDEYAKLVRRLGYVAPATALAMNMHCYWTGVAADLLRAGDESLPVDPRAGRRGQGVRRPPRRGRQRPPAAARRRPRRAGRRRLGDLGPQDLRQPLAGVGLRRLPRHGHLATPSTRRSSTGSCPARRPGYQIVDTWDTLGMRATQSQDTVLDEAFVPGRPVPGGVPGRLRRRRPVPRGDLRLGAARASPPSTSAPPGGPSTSPSNACRSAPRSR